MPEGPEIRLAADKVSDAIKPYPVNDIFFAFEHLKCFEDKLRGRRVVDVRTRGKAMLIDFENELSIYSHNQLYGRWMIRKSHDYPSTGRQLRLAIHNAKKSALLYSASDIQVLNPQEIEAHPFLSGLGPDILSADAHQVLAQLKAKRFARRRLGSLLLDQRFLAGVGNYLRSEILFVARVHPSLRPVDCNEQQLRELADAALGLGRQSYRHRGITNDLEQTKLLRASGQRYGRSRHWVFARGGEPCRVCCTPIVESLSASRRIYHCPSCQPIPLA